ncbi:ankyrin repeat-containing protein NPR4-like [Pistacia vera]|uniref:ankyrin repeat-containing protein NPR4-like n=1 Tax=Pistacia vera TaxID=55513 RepID=UPI0012632B7B|nr:ankyrin repeat-containing protein NPR4-like [Pistacia vera]
MTGKSRPYQAALEEDWDYLKKFFKQENASALSIPLTAARDTAFHLAVFSNRKQPLEHLLDIAKENPMAMYAFSAKNEYGDTALHEAAANGNLGAVNLLVKYNEELSNEDEETEFLEDINGKGKTPLFKAAGYGRTKVVKFLASEQFKQLIKEREYKITETGIKEVQYTKLKDIHRQLITHIKREAKPEPSKPPIPTQEEETIEVHGPSILHVAIRGEYFETALLLLKLDKGLATLEDKNGWTSLHLLATMPSAFKSGYRMGTWISRVFYFCLPINDRIDDEMGSCFNLFKGFRFGDSVDDKELCCLNLFKGWWILGKICSPARKICKAKRKHKLASRLAKSLTEEDDSWIAEVIRTMSSPDADEQGNIQARAPIEEDSKPSPLFMATEKGIIKIVKEILKFGPQLIEHKNHLKQNILHVAIKHRQKKIFDHVKRMKIPMIRLVRGIDKNGYTILHHAANTRDDSREIHPAGPVYELQEELKWYKRVEKMTPPHFLMSRDSEYKKTSKEVFDMKHHELLEEAQKWIKETSQSCSAVSVLVATVVFAAAYTVPGGSNEKGYPVFLNNNFFLIFTVMDVVALACSLTSVVMFLSVLTSPFHYEEFIHRLPRKLTIGFALLFVALTTTMLAFAATLLLIVRFEKPRWTTTLIYTAAFLPVSIFALTQFPMYVAFQLTLLKFYRWIKKDLRGKQFKKWLATKFQCYKKNDDHETGPLV